MAQRKAYDPLLLTSKSTELLSLTAISGIILRTQHQDDSTTEYLCCTQQNDQTQQHTQFIYESQESVIQDQFNRFEQQKRQLQAQKIQIQYQKQLLRLKTIQINKIYQLNRSQNSNGDVSQQLCDINKARQKVQKKKQKMKCSLQLMLIHMNRSYNTMTHHNKNLQIQFFSKMKSIISFQKALSKISALVNVRYLTIFSRLRKQQKLKKITLKLSSKVMQIQDILRKQMCKSKRADKQNEQKGMSIVKKIKSKIPTFI